MWLGVLCGQWDQTTTERKQLGFGCDRERNRSHSFLLKTKALWADVLVFVREGQLLRRQICPRIPGTRTHACTASTLTDGRQVPMPEKSNMVSSRWLRCENSCSFKYLNPPSLASCVHEVPVCPTVHESIAGGGFSKIYSISAARFQKLSPANLRHLSFLQQISAELTLLKTPRPLIYNLITVILELGFKSDYKALEPGLECMNTAFSHEGY